MYDTLVERLKQENAQYIIHEHQETRTYADAMEKLSFPGDRLLKTVAFRTRQGKWILTALRGEDRVDYRKLAGALGVRRDDVFRASPEEVQAVLGVEVGAVGPIPTAAQVEVLFDDRVTTTDTVFCGIGRPDRTLEIILSELVRITGGRVLSLAQEAKQN